MLGVMGATSKSGVLRPFDRRRDGFNPGEGSALLALEREEVALGRGAEILGEVVSYGASNDARSLTAPHPDGRGVVQAMGIAIERAAIAAGDIDYINAHGTSTRLNDRIETDAIKEVLGEHALRIPVSSVKGSIGHLGGAAGSVEAVLTLLALRSGVAPPTVGLEEPDDELDLDYVLGEPSPLARAATGERLIGLSNSFGFGGHNATVALAAEPVP
jgi:3-oxoacyl-[acyl-carrier-protein] synthase II